MGAKAYWLGRLLGGGAQSLEEEEKRKEKKETVETIMRGLPNPASPGYTVPCEEQYKRFLACGKIHNTNMKACDELKNLFNNCRDEVKAREKDKG
uniref:CHCH domain-containing protein n=1 Tax=Acrobeloides nanus TaxID=290746 RepID=A0A914CRT6_9BILA